MSKARNWWWYIDRIRDFEAHMHAIKRTVHHEKTQFQEVGICESVTYGKILTLDGDMQSSQFDEFIYHESLVQPAMVAHKNPEKVLILGGGEGATLREVLRHKTVKKAVMIDIDGRLIEICRQFIPEWSRGAFDDRRTELHITDALKWLDENEEVFDVIVNDLTDPLPYSPSQGLYSTAYFETLKKTLAPDGILAIQTSRMDFNDVRTHSVVYGTLREVFPVVQTCLSYVPGFDIEWSFTVCTQGQDIKAMPPGEIDERISQRIGDGLSFYDGETHQRIFNLPKHLRRDRDGAAENAAAQEKGVPFFIDPFYII